MLRAPDQPSPADRDQDGVGIRRLAGELQAERAWPRRISGWSKGCIQEAPKTNAKGVIDGYYDDASAAATQRAAETGATWMHPFDQPEVVAGQGTIGLELSEQAPDADTVLVAVGGGGLIAGIASWFAGHDLRVIGVEPVTSRCLQASLEAGGPVDVPVSGRAADSLGTRRAGDIAFAVASAGHVDHVVLVDDDAILEAQRAIWRELRMFAEPGGAAALAAVMCGAYTPEAGERLVVLVCGANGDHTDVIGSAPD